MYAFYYPDALESYIELHKWQLEQIRKGEEDIKAGRWIGHGDLKRRWEKRFAKDTKGKKTA